MDEIEPHDPWAASDGLPEVADDDSYADSVREAARDPNAPAPLPPSREDGPLGLDEYGANPDVGLRGEPLTARLNRETPDIGDDRLEPDPRMLAELDPDAGRPSLWPERDEFSARDEAAQGEQPDPAGRVAEDSRTVVEEAPLESHLGSHVSVYDRHEEGIESVGPVGEVVRPGGGYPSYERDEIAFDLGAGLGGLGNEELAMHEIPPEEAELEESQSNSEPYVARSYVVRTGAEQQWDPEDLAVAEGRDPTPRNIERARRELERWGQAAIEKTVP